MNDSMLFLRHSYPCEVDGPIVHLAIGLSISIPFFKTKYRDSSKLSIVIYLRTRYNEGFIHVCVPNFALWSY